MSKSSQKLIKSNKNHKRLRTASSSKNTFQTPEFLYGILPVQQALLHCKRTMSLLYIKDGPPSERIQELCRLAGNQKIPVQQKSSRELDALCPSVTHQGVVLACGPLPYAEAGLLDRVSSKNAPVFVALDQIEDPHNFGAIVRSCSFFNISGVIVPQHHASPLTSTVSKTSAGVVEHFPVIAVANLARFLKEQKKKGYWIVGLDFDAEQKISSLTLDRPLILVLGNEGRGIRPLVRATCDWQLSIPGNTGVSSLNVSNAAAIALYQLSVGL
ncbi:MAG: 23S rRNA (guanosine(2251)-2'-O)-methyltransferase RlmB [SAR324 cluster bacterium]|nr:23S rRNA (guanosine(2251)-2'-O)-methyltransferase RlmB [SAR324 cluster bacterium]